MPAAVGTFRLAVVALLCLGSPAPGDSVRTVVAQAHVTQHPFLMDLTQGNDIWRLIREQQNVERTRRIRFVGLGDVLVWKLPNFMMGDGEIDRVMRHAAGFKRLVVDLRDDPGGLESTLLRLAGDLIGADTVGVRRERT